MNPSLPHVPRFPHAGAAAVLATVLTVATPGPALAEDAGTSGWVAFDSFRYEGSDPVYEASKPDADEYYNPVLSGFYPDPSICRAGDDFYLVNSTFTYFPGVPIFHSRDLVGWRQIGHVLDRPSQLDLDGLPVSSGIFAPAITHHEGTFHMITTNVRGIGNFVVTATDPAGPWSDPVRLDFDGIDPSIFFDDDGKAYIVHNGNPPDKQPQYDGHRAIWLWEYDPARGSVRNGRIIINGGVDITKEPVWIEGPHLFKRNGFYYLCCAEGGTGPDHSQVIFRTKSLDEPFVPGPVNPILTQRDLDPDREHPVTALGHADLVETPSGEWWAVFLGIRPYEGGKSNIGRETFLLPVTWKDDWPMILEPGRKLPRVAKRPQLEAGQTPAVPPTGSFTWEDSFDDGPLGLPWIFLRTPRERWWSLDARKGMLAIDPRPVALDSSPRPRERGNGNPSFVARRQQHVNFRASTVLVPGVDAEDCDAGLAALQNDTNYLFLAVRCVEGKASRVILEQHQRGSREPEVLVSVPLAGPSDRIELRMTGAGKRYDFDYRAAGGAWTSVRSDVDGSLLSTEAAGGFVGAVIGLYARSAETAE